MVMLMKMYMIEGHNEITNTQCLEFRILKSQIDNITENITEKKLQNTKTESDSVASQQANGRYL